MKTRKKINYSVRIFLGVFLLAIGALAFFNAFYYNNSPIIFWFCYLCVPLAGLGILINNPTIVKSQLYILAIPDLIWVTDFFYFLINGHSLLGIVDYLFKAGDFLPKLVTMQHLIAIPIMFYSLVILKNKDRSAWKISLIQVTIVYFITRIFTAPQTNVNCVYDMCGNISLNLGGGIYPLIWFIGMFLMIYISREMFIKLHRMFGGLFERIRQIG